MVGVTAKQICLAYICWVVVCLAVNKMYLLKLLVVYSEVAARQRFPQGFQAPETFKESHPMAPPLLHVCVCACVKCTCSASGVRFLSFSVRTSPI